MTRLLVAIRSNPLTTVGIVLGIVAVIAVGIRGEDTRDIVQQSPCTAAPASAACQQTKRQSDKARSVKDTCIAFRRVGYRCPVGDVREGVVQQQGSNPSQPPGPSGGVTTSQGGNNAPSLPPDPGATAPPAPPNPDSTGPSAPDSPGPSPAPPEPAPVEPVAPTKPLIDLRPVTDSVCGLTRPVAAIC